MKSNVKVTIKGKTWVCSAVDTPIEISNGLKGVRRLTPATGMLFDYGKPLTTTAISMQGMLFPIDIVFISADHRVIGVYSGLLPGMDNAFVSEVGTKYVVEMNMGESDGIVPGDTVSMPFMKQPIATPPTPTPTASPVTSRPLAIPHPEEPMNPSATLANTDVTAIITKWLLDWGVPAQYWDYWKTAIDIQVYDIYPANITAMGLNQDTPAGTWEAGGKRHLVIKPKWLNPGVIAHEQAHNSYALLTPSQKTAFSAVYTPLKNTDPLVKLLYSKNTYGLTNDVEGHAEVYRYIGQHMPTQLKPYYPKLF